MIPKLLTLLPLLLALNCQLASTEKCGGRLFVLRGIHGIVLSPNYGGLYYRKDYCQWRIEAPTMKRIILHFDDFSVEGDAQCGFDYVKIFDGPSESSKDLGRFCGESQPLDVISGSNSIFITFKSDGTNERKGFKVTYDVIDTLPQLNEARLAPSQVGIAREKCAGQTIPVTLERRGSDVTLVSPMYAESKYPAMDSCTWVVQAPKGDVIRISFDVFGLQDSTGCLADWLEVIDGPSDHHPSLARLCGYSKPKDLLSGNNVVIIKFSSNAYIEDEGFRLRVIAEASPNVPAQRIYRNREVKSTISRRQLNDLMLPPPDFLGERDRCNGKRTVLSSRRGRIDSPNYGTGFYYSNDDCVWLIEVPAPSRIRLTFKDFQLAKTVPGFCENETGDLLTIYDGPSDKAPVLARLCGNELPGNIVSTQNSLFLVFKSDSEGTLPGFSSVYSEIAPDFTRIERSSLCRGRKKLLTDASGYIMSPNYMHSKYNPNDECQWLIQQQGETPIRIEFEDFDIEESTSCTGDHLAIYSGSGAHAPLLASLCGSGQPPPITVPGGSAFLRFVSDGHVQGRGFKLRFTTSTRSVQDKMCDADLTVGLGDGHVQSSSHWRNHYPWLGLFDRHSGAVDAPCCWSTGLRHEPGAFLQYDLGDERLVTGFVTRGSSESDEWVTSYYISTSLGYPIDWKTIKNDNDFGEPVDRVFPGNRDSVSTVVNRIWPPIRARYVRLLPRAEHRWMTTKFAVLGCR